jgi:hypothetical protein
MGVYLIGVYLMGVCLIYEPSSSAGHRQRESYIDTEDVFRASDCGRLGRQAADTLGARSAW